MAYLVLFIWLLWLQWQKNMRRLHFSCIYKFETEDCKTSLFACMSDYTLSQNYIYCILYYVDQVVAVVHRSSHQKLKLKQVTQYIYLNRFYCLMHVVKSWGFRDDSSKIGSWCACWSQQCEVALPSGTELRPFFVSIERTVWPPHSVTNS